MGLARKYQICVSETPYYHIISRCVRRAFLGGEGSTTGFSYELRRKWIVQRMQYLVKLFSIDVCAYTVMSNHCHLVLKVNSTVDWTDKMVLIPKGQTLTWAGLFELPLLCERFVRGEHMSKPELDLVDLTGRVIVANKRGFIPPELTPILQRLNLNPDTWLDELNSFKSIGITAIGTVEQLKDFCKQVGTNSREHEAKNSV